MKVNKDKIIINKQTGFSMVELMVGILISLLVSVSVMGTARFMDVQKRTTVGVAGNLETITLISSVMSNEIKLAGYGMTTTGGFTCEKAEFFKNGVRAATDAGGFLPPIQMVDGGDGLSDTLRVTYAESPIGSSTTTMKVNLNSATKFTQPFYTSGTPSSSTIVDFASPFILDTDPSLTVTGILTIDGDACTILSYSSKFGIADTPTVPVIIGSRVVPIYNFQDVTYRVNNGKLIRHDNFVAGVNGDEEIAEGVVFMKVSGLVANQWFAAKDVAQFNNTSLISQIGKTSPSAIKVHLVVRDATFNKKEGGVCVTTTQAQLDAMLPWSPAAPTVNLMADPDWGCYRYKAQDFVVPLKNLVLGSQP